jgi:pyruvate/2-oxoglutarate dehydrogenase complex dihydrolipoamide acyltransferase (E2) component
MQIRYVAMGALLGTLAFHNYSAEALTMHECSAKYQAAKGAGTLNGMKWNEFRKSQCGAEATAAPAPAPAAAPAPVYAPTAHALSMRECSVKYKAAKEAGTLNGMKWNEFRRAQCAAEATAAPPTAPAPAPSPAPWWSPGTVGNAVFPSAVDPRYSDRSAGKARMETCLDQYRANKANNANGGLKWIQRGGGYYSECVKRLKGQA